MSRIDDLIVQHCPLGVEYKTLSDIGHLVRGNGMPKTDFTGAGEADLYVPLTMPPELTKAHGALDRAVDRLYRKKSFASDKKRLELLFERYQELAEAKE